VLKEPRVTTECNKDLQLYSAGDGVKNGFARLRWLRCVIQYPDYLFPLAVYTWAAGRQPNSRLVDPDQLLPGALQGPLLVSVYDMLVGSRVNRCLCVRDKLFHHCQCDRDGGRGVGRVGASAKVDWCLYSRNPEPTQVLNIWS
jgi:hypothetical protein